METMSRRQAVQRLGALAPGLALTTTVSCTPEAKQAASVEQPRKPRAFKRSDVVFAFVFTPEEYKLWNANVLFGWCGGPETREEIPKYVERQKNALEAGVRMGTSISGFSGGSKWFKERDPKWQDALWRDVNGKLITYPWVRQPDPFPPEKGEICTNHPRFLEKKLAETELGMAVKPYAFHIDDPLGTATELRLKGCMCNYCVAGFRDYLKKNVAADKLRAAGITDLDSVDQREVLRGKSNQPLWYEFENFQLRASVEHVKTIFDRAREKRGEWIPVGANAPVVGAHIVFAPYLDYIAAEIGTDARQMKFGAKPLLNYKMGDSLGVAIAATGIYRDWAILTEHDIPDLVRGWVAESYALGHNFIVPHKEWGFVQPPGHEPKSTAYPGKSDTIGPLYRFVRQNPELFDDYEAFARVGLLYDYKANRIRGAAAQMPQTPEKQAPAIHEICLDLADANVPFGIVVAGSEPFDHEISQRDLDRYDFLLVNEPVMVEGKQRVLLDDWAVRGKVVKWTGISSMQGHFERLIAAEPGGGTIWVLPRLVPGNQEAPLVCHVLNRVFDAKAEKMTPQQQVKVSLHKSVFGTRKREKCTLLMERQPARELPVSMRRDMVDVTIPELELWGVLRFT